MRNNVYDILEKECNTFDTITLTFIENTFKCDKCECESCKNLKLCDAILDAHSSIQKIIKSLHESARQLRIDSEEYNQS